ncbi:hypothetical protein [Tomitella biformata]|uniref:hypothetical protein n=1 Tax=Tomitella biformata TaxID=630403 RepID=UPI0004B9A712|nr:hypothetical protein [Tomitella biformata]
MLAVVGLLVLAAVIFGWLQLREHNENQNSAAAASCFDGDRTLTIAADPGIAPVIEQIAARYGETQPVVRDQCITVSVQAESADQVLAALDESPVQDLPAVWIAQSGADLDQARASHPDALSSASRSVATSPVLLVLPEQQATALAQLSWQELPARQSAGELGLTLPGGADSGPGTLALSAVAAAVAGSDGKPVTAEQAGSPAVRDALTALRAGTTGQSFDDTAAALAAVTGDSPGVLAVPVTEQQFYMAVKDQQNPSARGLSPAGATPVADFPATTLRAAEADETLSRAASAFNEFARQPDQLGLLAESGFQVEGAAPVDTDNGVVSFTRPQSVLPLPQADAIAKIAPRRGGAQQAHATTVLLDVSGSMRVADGNQSRLLNVTEALRGEIAALPDDAAVGLWRYSANLDGTTPYAIDVTTGPLGEPVGAEGQRRQLLDTALSLASPVSATHTYRSLQAAYASAVEGFRPDQANSVLLITDGPNDDQSNLDSAALLRNLAAAQDPARPVAVNVIVISPNTDLATLQAIADQTGGTLTFLNSSADPQLPVAIHTDMG